MDDSSWGVKIFDLLKGWLGQGGLAKEFWVELFKHHYNEGYSRALSRGSRYLCGLKQEFIKREECVSLVVTALSQQNLPCVYKWHFWVSIFQGFW